SASSKPPSAAEDELMFTPGRRCRVSATLCAGSLPTSSAVTTSTRALDSRLVSSDFSIEPRIPVTVTVSRSVADWGASCACALKARQLTMAAESRVLRCMLSLLNILRSEEHTSELQSRENLVCRLLLEKKKNMCDR